MKLTKREQAAVLRAAELIVSGERGYSCLAISQAVTGNHLANCDLSDRYAHFYQQKPDRFWGGIFEVEPEERRDLRVLLLLLFLEVNK